MTAQHLPQEPRIERRRRPSGRRAAALDLTARADREAERQTDLDAVVADRELERAGSLPGLPQAAGDPVISASAAVPPPASALRATAEPTAADPRAVAAPGVERAPSGLVLEGPGRRVVLISADAGLVQEMTAVCAAAEARLSRARGLEPGQLEEAAAESAELILLDARSLRAAEVRSGTLPAPAVLLGTAEDEDLWELASRVGECTVAVLPAAEPWLADRLADVHADSARMSAGVLGVMGAAGGAGASTLSCWLAASAAQEHDVVLVDGDPDSCGIDLLLGTELLGGLRWPDLVGSHGALSSQRLWEVLPDIEGLESLRWLSWDRREPVQAPVPEVLRTLRRACDVVVLDLGRGTERSFRMAGQCDAVLVVVPRTLRGMICALRVGQCLGGIPVEYVLAGPAISDVSADGAAEHLGIRPLGALPFDARVAEACEVRDLLPRGRRRRHAETAAALWEQLDELHGLLAEDVASAAGTGWGRRA
ncbi:septum site-determining protein Ssd [Kocuria palustris]|uniref:septum site-determining protein Ssd n=1 Tax=Kocuria palustris TaxID=71999 RepID=UPI0035D6AF80